MANLREEINNTMEDAYNDTSSVLGTKVNPVSKPTPNIGVDTDNEFYENIIAAGSSSVIDIGAFNSFEQLSQNRETLYQVLDTMAEDPTIASMIEIYAEDATEVNDVGQIIWSESSDPKINSYITFLLKSLNVDKNIYPWVRSLIKYGDIYLRLYRESDFEEGELFDESQKTSLNEKFVATQQQSELDESVKIKAYSKSDKLVNYIDLVPNPAEMFELTKFGKSYAYIKTNTLPQNIKNEAISSSYYTYRFKRNDVDVYNAVSFVHGALQDDISRMPEQVQLFFNGSDENEDSYTYNVRRGQSILYNAYKIWRQMMLLENALLLNRLTKSSILRVIEVEVADMPKERVGPHLQRIKSMVEQKSSISTDNRMIEYTNPGAIENNIYVPTHNGIGAINSQQIGGDVNVKDIADIDYFKNKFYSSMKIPKQFLGDTDDATGFNGGTSLSILSSRYAKTVKRIQATMCQCLTDAINIILIDNGLDSYVNKFTLHMQPPVTQEELDKRDNTSSKVQITDDVMRLVDTIEDPVVKLKILKSLLSNSITNVEVIELIQDEISRLEAEAEDSAEPSMGDDMGLDGDDFGGDFNLGGDSPLFGDDTGLGDFGIDTGGPEVAPGDDNLPTPAELDVGDMSDMV